MDLSQIFQTLAISLGLGLLVGFQRERVETPIAGVRTFPLITVLGTLSGLLAGAVGPWIVAAGLLGVTAAFATSNLASARRNPADPGITTEIAVLLMYLIGAYLVFGHRSVAVVLGAGVAVLLHAKPAMQGLVKHVGETDMRVIMQFVLITLVILPALPDRPYGPFAVFNPREIWWMVVLVVGISLCGYFALKLYGQRAGVLLAGLIGGLISSTATTLSYARRTVSHPGQVTASTVVILLASTVVYVRVLVEVFAVAPRLFAPVAPPIAILLGVAILTCLALLRGARRVPLEAPEHGNPTELRPALLFGGLYALVLFAVEAARHLLGERGVFVAAGISGLTDMDAITLSLSRLGARGDLPEHTVWRAIVIALASNLIFKTALVAFLGGWTLGRRVGSLFGIQLAAAALLVAVWPW